jgi:hypothetical protein
MVNATFCCLFHEIILSTWRDIKDVASQCHAFKRSPICKFIHDITSGK